MVIIMRCSDYNFEGFVGVFKELLIQYVQMKQALGYNFGTTADGLKRFSKFSLQFEVENHVLNKELVEAWTVKRPNEKDVTCYNRLNDLKRFAKYLTDLGYDAYIPACKININRKTYVPYIFNDAEVRLFFNECDKIKPHPLSNKHLLLPTLFRLLYGCGLRISEAVALKLKNIDFAEKVITIYQSKHDKDRLIPMSVSLTKCMKSYHDAIHNLSTPDDYLFINKDKTAITADAVYRNFRIILWRCGISHGGKSRGPRMHDFGRHTFAVNALRQLLKQGLSFYSALPILSTYLGHASISATEHYVRITQEVYPEILEKTSSYSAFVFPEVEQNETN